MKQRTSGLAKAHAADHQKLPLQGQSLLKRPSTWSSLWLPESPSKPGKYTSSPAQESSSPALSLSELFCPFPDSTPPRLTPLPNSYLMFKDGLCRTFSSIPKSYFPSYPEPELDYRGRRHLSPRPSQSQHTPLNEQELWRALSSSDSIFPPEARKRSADRHDLSKITQQWQSWDSSSGPIV